MYNRCYKLSTYFCGVSDTINSHTNSNIFLSDRKVNFSQYFWNKYLYLIEVKS